MAGMSISTKGNFNSIDKFLTKLLDREYLNVLDEYGKKGVEALRKATPKRTGLTSESWDYIIQSDRDNCSITFVNSNIQNGENIAIIIEYGHGLKGGGYVQGRHYIDPAIQPIFDEIAEEAWKEVTKW